jgi:hypothetical protein
MTVHIDFSGGTFTKPLGSCGEQECRPFMRESWIVWRTRMPPVHERVSPVDGAWAGPKAIDSQRRKARG